MLLLTTCANINIYQVVEEKIEINTSFYLAYVTQTVLLAYLILLIVCLRKNKSKLHSDELRQLVGAAYEKFNVKRSAKSAIVVISCIHARNLGFSLAMTFGTGHLVA